MPTHRRTGATDHWVLAGFNPSWPDLNLPLAGFQLAKISRLQNLVSTLWQNAEAILLCNLIAIRPDS